jgi:hypothetical protein
MMRKLLACLVIFIAVHSALLACDMSAVLMKEGKVFSDFNAISTGEFFSNYYAPLDYLAYVMSRSHPAINNDGYGIVYYSQYTPQISASQQWYKRIVSAQSVNQVYYTGNLFTHSNPQDIFDVAIERMQLRDARASIIMCHARNATANPFAPGNHPFSFNLNNVTYTLMHNGFISLDTRRFMINEIASYNSDWFADNHPNLTGFDNSNNPENWIDSEVLFHYLMCHIKQNDNDVYKGLKLSLKKIEHFMKLSTNVVNFVLSNGQQLYVFRSSSLTDVNSIYKLSFKDSSLGFYAVRSGVPTIYETQVNQFELVIFSAEEKIQRYPTFLYDEALTAYRPGHNNVTSRRSTHPALGNNESGIRIAFSLTTASRIKLNVYNMKGQLVKQLADKVYLAGSHTVYWKRQSNNGNSVAPGVYFIETINGSNRSLNKVLYYR